MPRWPWGVFAFVGLLVAYGIATNSGQIGMLLGYCIAFLTDPLQIVISIVVGAVARNWWTAAIVLVLATVAMQALIVLHNAGGPIPANFDPMSILARFLVFAVLSGVVALIVGLVRRASNAPPRAIGEADPN
jgi:hypothetical protein